MLDLHNSRYLLSELLEPPPGYEFTFALATTFSLDLNTLLTVPLKLLRGGEADPQAAEVGLPMLQALHERGRQLRVFCQQGRILFPQVQHPLLCWLEEVVVPVTPPAGGSFHPKLWVVRYEARADSEVAGAPAIYRCLVGSRNLTYDQSADVMASLDGTVSSKRQKKATPLVKFFSELCAEYLPNEDHRAFLEELSRAKFTVSDPFTDFDFFIDRGERPIEWIPESFVGALVVSPFLSPAIVRQFIQRRTHRSEAFRLVSRREELAKLSEEDLRSVQAYHLKDTALAEFADPELSEDAVYENMASTNSTAPAASPSTRPELHDIHAKVYAFSTSLHYHFLLGSANLTNRAHRGVNVEAMLSLTGTANRMNRHYLASALDLDKADSLFERYEYRPDAAPTEATAAEQLDAARAALVEQLMQAKLLSAELVEQPNDYYQLRYSIDLRGLAAAKNIRTNAVYLYRPARPEMLEYGELNTFNVDRLNPAEVSRWLAFELTHVPSGERERFVLLADFAVPPRRDDLILSSLFTNRDAFFSYLQLLLHDAERPEWNEDDGLELGAGPGIGRGVYGAAPPLYEDLARRLALHPERLGRVDVFVQLLERDERMESLQLQEFSQLWAVFRQAMAQTIPG